MKQPRRIGRFCFNVHRALGERGRTAWHWPNLWQMRSPSLGKSEWRLLIGPLHTRIWEPQQ